MASPSCPDGLVGQPSSISWGNWPASSWRPGTPTGRESSSPPNPAPTCPSTASQRTDRSELGHPHVLNQGPASSCHHTTSASANDGCKNAQAPGRTLRWEGFGLTAAGDPQRSAGTHTARRRVPDVVRSRRAATRHREPSPRPRQLAPDVSRVPGGARPGAPWCPG